MKDEQFIRERLVDISTKINFLYQRRKQAGPLTQDDETLLHVLLIREDMLEWVLEENTN